MKHFKYATSLVVLALAGSSFSLAEDAPPLIPGNPGVPGFKAEIEALQTQLAATESELAITEAELAATESELAITQTNLAEIHLELNNTNDELDATLDELATETKRYRVPQTGQSQCWDAVSNDPDDPHFTVPCTLNGQDGDTQAGLAPPPNRFADNGDGTVTDNFTGLVWLKNANCLGLNPPDWKTSLHVANQLPGHSSFIICELEDGSDQGDWRVPSVNELMSLVQFGADTFSGAGLPGGHPFSEFDGYYWTSTTFSLRPDQDVAGFLYPCRRQGYVDNRFRFNDAYVVSITTGEVVRMPKELGPNISKRHKTSDGGSCVGQGFTNGSPGESPYSFPTPRFIAVRDATG